MKRCPSCGRTFANDAQKFCTRDGAALVDAGVPGTGQGETIRIPSAPLNASDDETTKSISSELAGEDSGEFDPYKTIVSAPRHTSSHDTHDRQPPADSATGPESQPLDSSDLMMRTMASIPSMQSQPSTPLSAPLPAPATPAPMPQPPISPSQTQTPRRAKRSKLPLVLGILAVLFLIGVAGVAVGYFFVLKPMLETKRETVEPTPNPSPTPIVKSTPGPRQEIAREVLPYSPPPDAVQFVNSIDNLDGKLKEHYVDFSFYYPESWQKDPKAGVPGASNFAKVERRLPPDSTQENFAVGSYSSAGSEEGDRAVFHTLAENLSAQYQKNFPEYRKVSEGPTKVGPYDGYQFHFESMSRNTDKGDIKIWGRVIFVPPVDGGKNGVTLLMLATSLAPELRGVNDVGVKGELPMMLESFRFGK